MQLATVLYGERTYAARVGDDHFELLEPTDVGALLAMPGGVEAARTAAATSRVGKDAVTVRALVPRPPKVLCIGQNYLRHIEETGATVPDYPTVFAKYTTLYRRRRPYRPAVHLAARRLGGRARSRHRPRGPQCRS